MMPSVRAFIRLAQSTVMLLLVAAYAQAEAINETRFGSAASPRQLVIESTTDLAIISPLIEAFLSNRPDLTILYRELETVELFERTEKDCASGQGQADIIFSSAMNLQVKLVNDGCAQAINNPALDQLPDYARWRNELFGLTFEPAVIVYNRRLVSPFEAPKDHFDLLDLLRQEGRFSGSVGTYDIEVSGLGYQYATLDAQQSSTYGRFIEAMGRNGVELFCCTSEILAKVADGRLAFGYNVLGSYAFAEAENQPDLAVVLPSDYTLVLTRAAFVPKSAKNPVDANAFLGFTQSSAGRNILNTRSRLFSPIGGAETLFKQTGISRDAGQSLRPVPLSPALLTGIDRMKREVFLRQWRASLEGRKD